MKKVISVIMFLVLVFTLSACGTVKDADGNKISKQDTAYINKAVKEVKKQWKEYYTDSYHFTNKSDKTVEIINTRIIHIKENNTDLFKDVEAVVEFDIFSDYYGHAPYYSDVRQDNCVLFYKDGSCEVTNDYLRHSIEKDWVGFPKIFDSITECGTAFNTGKIKHAKANSDNKKYVSDAIELIRDEWKNRYQNIYGAASTDGALKIINTRLFFINSQSQNPDFDNIEAIVEFELQADEHGLAPYYMFTNSNNTVVFYKDGQAEVATNYIESIRAKTYDLDLSIFSEILDFGSEFNDTINVNSTGITLLDKDMSDEYDENH